MSPTDLSMPASFVNRLLPQEYERLKAVSSEKTFKKGEYIFQANKTVHIMQSGKAKVARMSLIGNELIQWFCLPGDIFGISGENTLSNKVYAKALTPCKTLCIQKQDFNDLILAEPRIGMLVIEKLTTRLHTLGDMVLYMASDDTNTRFIKLLGYLCDNYGTLQEESIFIDIPTTHQDFANMIGSCRQTVSTIVSQLKRDGILDISRKGISIYQPAYLKEQIKH